MTIGLKANSDGVTGAIQLNGTDVAKLNSSGLLGFGGPAFSVYMSANQNITTGVETKLNFDTEQLDSVNCYDTTNKRFTPNVAGWYMISAGANFSAASAFTSSLIVLYKNGAAYKRGTQLNATATFFAANISCIVYCNGTTDYIEVYGFIGGTTPVVTGGSLGYFDGFLVRAT